MKLLVLIVVLVVSGPLFAQQSLDLISLSYKKGFDSDISETDDSFTENTLFANLKIPIPISDKTILYNDVSYFGYLIQSGNSASAPGNLYGVFFQTGIIQQLSESTSLQLLFVPRLMSDFNNIDKSHIQLGGIGFIQKNYHPGLTLRYGLVANKEFFGWLFAPVVYIDWQTNQKWYVNGLMPLFTKLGYHATDKLDVGFHYYGINTSYRLGKGVTAGNYMERRSVDLSLFGRYNIVDNLYFEGRFGISVSRKYLQYSENETVDFRLYSISFGDDRTGIETNVAPSPIIDFRLVYNLKIE